MSRTHIVALLWGLSGILFLGVALLQRRSDGRVNAAFLTIGLVFVVLAVVQLVRARAKPAVKTDPRLPARKTHLKDR